MSLKSSLELCSQKAKYKYKSHREAASHSKVASQSGLGWQLCLQGNEQGKEITGDGKQQRNREEPLSNLQLLTQNTKLSASTTSKLLRCYFVSKGCIRPSGAQLHQTPPETVKVIHLHHGTGPNYWRAILTLPLLSILTLGSCFSDTKVSAFLLTLKDLTSMWIL